MSSTTRNKTFRLDEETLGDIQAERERLQRENDGLVVSEADALRVLVRRARGAHRAA